MFPQDHHVLACLALPGRLLVAVQLNDQTFLHVYDAVAEVSEYKKPLTGQKLVKLGMLVLGALSMIFLFVTRFLEESSCYVDG